MSEGNNRTDDPFVDPSPYEDESLVEATLFLARNASLTLGADALMVLGTATGHGPRSLIITKRLIDMQMKVLLSVMYRIVVDSFQAVCRSVLINALPHAQFLTRTCRIANNALYSLL